LARALPVFTEQRLRRLQSKPHARGRSGWGANPERSEVLRHHGLPSTIRSTSDSSTCSNALRARR
jgi:hypothetical protein